MSKKKLLFGIHCHQPYNNFFEIIKKATKKSYFPFLKILSEFPNIKLSIHYSGWLFEWIKNFEKDLFEIIKKMVDRGQVELFTSGYYEPILASIPEEDVVLQLKKSNKFLKDNFGIIPEGLWLTERVWDSKIVKVLVDCGIKYVTVDDYHFISAGFDKKRLQGYFLTEEDGYELGIFPISKDLRYAIPFKEVDSVIDFLENFETAIIFDDGEKFGWWPHTYEWVYEKKWLYNFFEKLTDSNEIETFLYKDYFKNFKPISRCYLPIASYFEMGEWSLNYENAKLFNEYYSKLKDEFKINEDILQKFFKGGIWKNFLIKYEEANNIHKKMIKVSKRIKRKSLQDEATLWVLKGQCNDCFWHGVFGGIYLPNLRDNAFISLNKAEKLLNVGNKIYQDFNYDGYNELEIRNENLLVMISEKNGAQVYELSDLETGFNILNTLTRRRELYHDEIINSKIFDENENSGENVKTIHEIKYKVTKDLKDALIFDKYLKYAFIDFIVDKDFQDLGNFTEDFTYDKDNDLFVKTGYIKILDTLFPIKFQKKFLLEKDGLLCKYRIKNLSSAFFDLMQIVELNFYFPGAVNKDSNIIAKSRKFSFFDKFEIDSLSEIKVFDFILNKEVKILCSENFRLKVEPIITVSKNEREYEKTYQGTSFSLIFPFNLKFKQKRELTIKVEIK